MNSNNLNTKCPGSGQPVAWKIQPARQVAHCGACNEPFHALKMGTGAVAPDHSLPPTSSETLEQIQRRTDLDIRGAALLKASNDARMNAYYASRAQAAYAAAEAASDPRDKAAFRAAAQTWEQLSKPATQPTYSMEPHRLQLTALKRDAAEAADAPVPAPTVQPASMYPPNSFLWHREQEALANPGVKIEF